VDVLAIRAAGRVRVDDPRAVALLLEALREVGASDAASSLIIRAAHHLAEPGAVAQCWARFNKLP